MKQKKYLQKTKTEKIQNSTRKRAIRVTKTKRKVKGSGKERT